MSKLEHEHIEIERLSDWIDGRMPAERAREIERHLAVCESCSLERERLVDLIAEARALPDTIEPPTELWSAVRGRLLPTSAIHSSLGATRRWQLAAAAVLLVALSASVTALLLRGSARNPSGRDVVDTQIAASTAAQPAPARALAADYETTISQLRETLNERRSQLDPGTVAKVEASLGVIDSAIAEARGALAADPSNLTLVDLLAASYERKLELLRLASELPSST